MPTARWPAELLPDELGAVVHGPVVLARSPGIAVGLRCVFAHPTGLHLPLVLLAEGVQAEAATRRSGMGRHSDEMPEHMPWSGLSLTVEMDGEVRTADPTRRTSSGSDDHYALAADHWIGALPGDGRLTLTAGWPEAGLAEQRTVLTLEDLDHLADRVVSLR